MQTAPEIENKLLSQELDCAFMMETGYPKEDLIYEPITTDKIVLAFSKKHLFSGIETLKNEDLNQQTLLVYRLSSSTGHLSNAWLHHMNLNMDTIKLDSVSTITKMLSYGKTIALISRRLIEGEADLTYIKLPYQDLEREIHFVYHRDIWKSEVFRYFQERVHHLK